MKAISAVFIIIAIICVLGSDTQNKGNAKGDPRSDFHRAAVSGDIERIKKFLDEENRHIDEPYIIDPANAEKADCGGCKFNVNVNNGTTLLHWAVKHSQLKTIEFLIERGADVNKPRNDGWTALHYACISGDTEIAALLLKKGAQVDAKMYEVEATPLNFAANKGFPKIVDLLIQNGANVSNQKKPDLRSPLFDAALNGHLSVVKLLIEKGKADWRIIEVEMTTPFHAAVVAGKTAVARYFIEEVGVDVTIQRNIEATAFHDVAVNGNLEILKLLIQTVLKNTEKDEVQRWTDFLKLIDSRTTEGVSPLKAAAFSGHDETVKMFLDYGASPKVLHNGGVFHVLEVAKHFGLDQMVKVITRLETTPVQEWDVHDVAYKVSQICQEKNLPRVYMFYFRKNKINGVKLLEFTSATELSNIGIENKDHQQILFDELMPKSGVDQVLDFFRNFGNTLKKLF